MKIDISEFLPLDSEESIKLLLHAIEKQKLILNLKEVGDVLFQIKKSEYQYMCWQGIEAINATLLPKAKKNKSGNIAQEKALPKQQITSGDNKTKKKRIRNKLRKFLFRAYSAETDKDEKRRKLRALNARGAGSRRYQGGSSSVYAISTPMGGKPKKY